MEPPEAIPPVSSEPRGYRSVVAGNLEQLLGGGCLLMPFAMCRVFHGSHKQRCGVGFHRTAVVMSHQLEATIIHLQSRFRALTT